MHVDSVLNAGSGRIHSGGKTENAVCRSARAFVWLASVTCSHERKSESAARTHSRDGDSRSGRGS